MELRARIRPHLRRATFAAASVALLASAVAGLVATDAHASRRRRRRRVITAIAPKHVAVGETLTIRGRNFLGGRSKNTVVFKRKGARAVFAKADVSTKKMLRVKVPATLQKFFALQAGNPVPTRFRLRVLADRFGKKFTGRKLSPIVSGPLPTVSQIVQSPDGDCDKRRRQEPLRRATTTTICSPTPPRSRSARCRAAPTATATASRTATSSSRPTTSTTTSTRTRTRSCPIPASGRTRTRCTPTPTATTTATR